MNNRILYSIALLSTFFLSPFLTRAQNFKSNPGVSSWQKAADSIRTARIQYADSLKKTRQHFQDSMRIARQARIDSLNNAQKRRSDSLKAIQAYRNSRHYKDSVAVVRQHRQDSILAARNHIIDSTKKVRQNYTDSIVAVRKHTLDSLKQVRQLYSDSLHAYFDSVRVARAQALEKLKAEREKRSDSLAVIRAYRNSKAFKDSLSLVRKQRQDSLIVVRKQHTDSIRAVQKAYTDSLITVRKAYSDSLKAAIDSMRVVRQHTIDSLTTVRKARADSLAKVRAARDEEREKASKEKEKKQALALEIKIQKKQNNYSNKKMLKKKWNLPRKVVQNTFTRYNYYYNADLKMQEARANMLRSRQDNYDSLLRLFPFDPNVDSSKLASDMDTIIKKASVGIQIHDPRSKWQDDLFLLVGQAYYYKADYKNAGAAFKQIIVTDEKQKKKDKKKNKKQAKDKEQETFSVPEKKGIVGMLKHIPAKNEAMLWLARTFVQSGEEGQAQTLLDLLRNEVNFPHKMKGKLALEQAFINLNNQDDKNALQSLSIVAKDDQIADWQRQRAGFIVGQLYERNGQLDSANHYFQKVVALHPPIQMDFYARKNIAFNELSKAGEESKSVQMLEGLAKDGKYKPFYDQIYYGIALAEQNAGNSEKAMKDFRKSLSFGKNNPKQMGLTYTKIGDAHYQEKAYVSAKGAYDSAAVLLKVYPDLTEYQRSSLRGTSLAKIVGPASMVARADSLIYLASLTEKEQRSIIRKYIRQLEKSREDSLFLAQNSATTGNSTGTLFSGATSQSWYFANSSLVSSGEMEFKQKWGNRKLTDNWRLGSNNFAGNNTTGNSNTTEQGDTDVNSGLPDEEALYAVIPHSSEALKVMKDTLEESLFLLGKGYYTYLEDFNNAVNTFDTLDKKFPSNPYQAEVLYLRYLMAMRTNDLTAAKGYQQALSYKFPESDWAQMLQTANREPIGESKTNDQSIDVYYNSTYNMLMQKQYALVLDRTKDYASKFPAPGSYANKFKILEAVAYAGSGSGQKADSILSAFVKQNPDDELTPWAKDVLNYLHHAENSSAAIPETSKTDNNAAGQKQVSANFTYNPSEPHYIIVSAPADMRIFALKSGLRDFNLMRAGSENISISMTTLNPDHNLIICQTFKNKAAAESYYKDILKNNKLFREYPQKEYHLLLISESNYSMMINERGIEGYLAFYKKYYQ